MWENWSVWRVTFDNELFGNAGEVGHHALKDI